MQGGRVGIAVDVRMRIGYARVGQGIVGIQRNGPFIHADRVLESPRSHRVEELAAAQVVVVGLGIGGGHVLDGTSLHRREGDLEGVNDALRDVVLDIEHVFQLPVVGF